MNPFPAGFVLKRIVFQLEDGIFVVTYFGTTNGVPTSVTESASIIDEFAETLDTALTANNPTA